jgi:hypothetical protein
MLADEDLGELFRLCTYLCPFCRVCERGLLEGVVMGVIIWWLVGCPVP